MEDIIIDNPVQHLYHSTAKDIYNLALNVYGNDTDALLASVDAFVKAFEQISNSNILNNNLFKHLSIRFLYKYGKSRKIDRIKNTKTLTRNFCHQEIHINDSVKLLNKLDQLNYNERFIILLFCCQKLRLNYISRILRLPKFLVTKWFLSAVHKIAFIIK